MSTNFEYRERERQRKRESRATGQRSSREKELERERKKKQAFFVGRTRKCCSGSEKMRNASSHQGENERQ